MIVEIYLLFLTEQRGIHNLLPVWLRGNNLLNQNVAKGAHTLTIMTLITNSYEKIDCIW